MVSPPPGVAPLFIDIGMAIGSDSWPPLKVRLNVPARVQAAPNPVWLPDSRHLMFVSGGRDFYVVDTRSRKVEKVFSVQGDIIGPPQLTRDGREAYFSRRVTEGDIWLLATNGSQAAP